ncbi:GtrA family protein [Youngiibacter multivorans]|uniref:Flippase GtrA n=1 Tax=Youngiibacter multivorans TaxID=937251 RepID=A0ABS4G7U4_9CLOT|nr:GtrA family protein [Youngiibacter multivorans]MBP1920616.1 putative flippase GtrA [Youngiibacter multivorans]
MKLSDINYRRHILENEKVMYLIVGVLTTLVNYILYFICRTNFGADRVILNTAVSWFGAVLFAFVTNRRFVFRSHGGNFSDLLRQVFQFYASRGASGLLELAIMYIFVELAGISDVLVKIAASIIIVILNYFLSKAIFRKRKESSIR